MKTLTRCAWVLGLAAALLATASTVRADFFPTTDIPASILIFPLYDATPGAGTILCVTNVNTSTVYCPETDFRVGDVLLHYLYIDGETCLEFDRYELLTPGDTLCVIANEHDPESDKGFLVVSARNPSDGTLLDFDALIGSAIVVQSDLNLLWSYKAYGFVADGLGGFPMTCAQLRNPDVDFGDADGVPDYDGQEYTNFMRVNLIDSFFEEGGSHDFMNQLTLMSTSGQDYINEMNVYVWNNSEVRFSRTFKFTCWWSGALSDITEVVRDLGGDEEELGHQTETGWVQIEGNRILDLAGNPVKQENGIVTAIPAVLGVFMQGINGTDYAMGHALQFRLAVEEDLIDGMEIEIGNGDPQQGD